MVQRVTCLPLCIVSGSVSSPLDQINHIHYYFHLILFPQPSSQEDPMQLMDINNPKLNNPPYPHVVPCKVARASMDWHCKNNPHLLSFLPQPSTHPHVVPLRCLPFSGQCKNDHTYHYFYPDNPQSHVFLVKCLQLCMTGSVKLNCNNIIKVHRFSFVGQ